MGSITEWVDVIKTVVNTAVGVANMSRSEMIGRLTGLRENLEQFKEAAEKEDVSKMRQLLESCKIQSEELEKSVFSGLHVANTAVPISLKKARVAKGSLMRRIEAPRKKAPTKKDVATAKKAVKAAGKAKSAGLEGALDDDAKSRKRLMKDIDTAIGRLQGMCISLETSKW